MIDSDARTISGIGEGRSNGRFAIPFAIRSIGGQTIAGVTISHQIEDANHPILLSIEMQAKQGFIKDVRAGTIKLLDYPDERLEIVRQAGTGLFMARIDHLSPYAMLNCTALPKGVLLHQWQKESYMRWMPNIKNKTAKPKQVKTVI